MAASLAIKRESNDLVTVVVGLGTAIIGWLGGMFTTVRGERSEFVKSLANELEAVRARVTQLENQARTRDEALDLERENCLLRTAERDAVIIKNSALAIECDGLKRENAALTERNVLLTARNLELEVLMAGRASVAHRQGSD